MSGCGQGQGLPVCCTVVASVWLERHDVRRTGWLDSRGFVFRVWRVRRPRQRWKGRDDRGVGMLPVQRPHHSRGHDCDARHCSLPYLTGAALMTSCLNRGFRCRSALLLLLLPLPPPQELPAAARRHHDAAGRGRRRRLRGVAVGLPARSGAAGGSRRRWRWAAAAVRAAAGAARAAGRGAVPHGEGEERWEGGWDLCEGVRDRGRAQWWGWGGRL